MATVLIAVVSGLFAYLAAKRRGSGTVKTSEATELWQANSEFRTMLIQEARDRANENAKLREEASMLQVKVSTLEKEVIRLKKIVGEPV
jgi:hypothetical protein